MIVEKSFKRAKLTHQSGDQDLTLEIIPHPTISGCGILTILDPKKTISVQITVNKLELKKAAEMLSGVGIDIE